MVDTCLDCLFDLYLYSAYAYTYLYIHVLIFYPNNEINVVSGVGRIQTKIEIEKGWCTAEMDSILVQCLERRLFVREKHKINVINDK